MIVVIAQKVLYKHNFLPNNVDTNEDMRKKLANGKRLTYKLSIGILINDLI